MNHDFKITETAEYTIVYIPKNNLPPLNRPPPAYQYGQLMGGGWQIPPGRERRMAEQRRQSMMMPSPPRIYRRPVSPPPVPSVQPPVRPVHRRSAPKHQCEFIMMRGANKGNRCDKGTRQNRKFCSRHKKHESVDDKSNDSSDDEVDEMQPPPPTPPLRPAPSPPLPPPLNLCAICLEDITARDCEYMPCTHSYHRKCIASWLLVDNRCPECRHTIDRR